MRALHRGLLVSAIALLGLLPSSVGADTLPSGERAHGNVTVEPAYDDFNGSIVYLQTPNRLAPLGPNNPILNVNHNAVAPLFLIVYPPGTPGTFNCMGNPGNCPDHDAAIAGVATSLQSGVYGTDPSLVPGHDHLVGLPHTGDFNVAWRVWVELFTSSSAVTHITTLSQLEAVRAAHGLQDVDTGITFACPVVSVKAYTSGTPVG